MISAKKNEMLLRNLRKNLRTDRVIVLKQETLEHFVNNIEIYKQSMRDGWSHARSVGIAKIEYEVFDKLSKLDLEAWILKTESVKKTVHRKRRFYG